MMSYIGIRRELVQLFDYNTLDSKILKTVRFIVLYLIRKALVIMISHMIYMGLLVETVFNPFILGNNQDSNLYYMFRNVFF